MAGAGVFWLLLGMVVLVAAGLLAVVIGVFWYLPDKMATIIETNPRVEETIRATATNFLQPDNEGGKFIAARLRSLAPQGMVS